MVSADVPVGVVAVVVTVIVALPAPATLGGLKEAEESAGSPVALRWTVPLKPFRAPMVTVYVVLPPRTAVLDPGDAAIVKSGAAVTPRLTVVDRVSAPLVAVMVSVELLVGVSAVVRTSSVVLPEPVTVAGLNEAVAFAGTPPMIRFTVPVNPFSAPMVTV